MDTMGIDDEEEGQLLYANHKSILQKLQKLGLSEVEIIKLAESL